MDTEDYKATFIRECLHKHAEYLIDISQQSIDDLTLVDSGDLQFSPKYKLIKRGDDFVLQFIFLSYGRAIEIAFHRRKQTNTREIIKQLYGVKSREDVKAERLVKSRKDTRWYSKNVWGSINNLWGKVAHGFTDDEIARIKGIIEGTVKAPHMKYRPIK